MDSTFCSLVHVPSGAAGKSHAAPVGMVSASFPKPGRDWAHPRHVPTAMGLSLASTDTPDGGKDGHVNVPGCPNWLAGPCGLQSGQGHVL